MDLFSVIRQHVNFVSHLFKKEPVIAIFPTDCVLCITTKLLFRNQIAEAINKDCVVHLASLL